MEISKDKITTVLRVARKAAVNPYVIGGILGTAVFAADQLFKSSVEMQDDANFPHDPVMDKDAAHMEFEKRHNPGICGGVLADKPKASLALTATGLAMAGASLAFRRKEDFIGKISDMVVIGGAASNLYDKVKRGYVVDYIHVKKGPLSRLVFNIADVAIAAGAATGTATRARTEMKRLEAAEEKRPGCAGKFCSTALSELKQRAARMFRKEDEDGSEE